MSLRIGDQAPDFEAQTTKGVIRFHEWLGNSWGILFSHPKDFTPVCTTELGYLAKLEPEFAKRNTKILGLSVDPVTDHERWLIKALLVYPMSSGRNFDEVLRLLDSMQLTTEHKVATPVNWKQGEDVIIVPSVSDDEAKQRFPEGWKTVKPYLRVVPQPTK